MKTKILILFILISYTIKAQSDSNSPYSLYGLGVENSNYFSGFGALGNTGIGYKSTLGINKSNPASLSNIPKTSFLYEIGLNGTYSNKKNNNTTQDDTDFNFTHIAMAFAINNNWGISFGLIPYTKVNYEVDTVKPIEGSTNYYLTNVIGSGGVNELFLATGLSPIKNLSLGVEFSALFGNIDQEQRIYVGNLTTYLKESNNYFGVGLKMGLQYTFNNFFGKKTTFGTTLSIPTTLKGDRNVEGNKSIESGEITIIDETENNVNNFDLPLKLGFGVSSKINNTVLLNIDYKKNYWEKTNNYKDQTIYGIGVEYKPSTDLNYYKNRITYRLGYNYNTGFFSISDKKINNYNFSIGAGFPISKKQGSIINLNYIYGKEGTLEKHLIKDSFHKISLNLSLIGNWFQKRKIF